MLRRILPVIVAGLLAAGILAGYNVAFAQDITSKDTLEAGQDTNTIWMFGAFLVFFSQAGFAFLGAGLIRARNTTNYMTKSFMDFSIASLSFLAFGFALMWGTSAAGIAGTTNFFITDGGGGRGGGDGDDDVAVGGAPDGELPPEAVAHRGNAAAPDHTVGA